MGIRKIYLAGGCFWGLEEYLSRIDGVAHTEVGYANGKKENPTYEDVCSGNTGFAETVEVTYDDSVMPLSGLLQAFFEVIDPTSRFRQGNDRGTQYRTGIYYTDERELPEICSEIQKLQKKYEKEIVTERMSLLNFYRAEEYHQDYLKKNPHGYCHIDVDKAASFCAAYSEERKREAVGQADRGRMEAAAEHDTAHYEPLSDSELQRRLTKLQYKVTRQNATEPPYANEYFNHFQKGLYVDVTTGEPLFFSQDKFDSGCGWPSFIKPVHREAICEKKDDSHGMVRTEVRSRAGDCHLGHVFCDGPTDRGGLRYCINSAALRFIPYEDMKREGYGDLIERME